MTKKYEERKIQESVWDVCGFVAEKQQTDQGKPKAKGAGTLIQQVQLPSVSVMLGIIALCI